MKDRILNATVDVFNDYGLKFTMDELAKRLGCSKKTIYKVFADKESLLLTMAERVFDEIKVSEEAIYRNPTLSTLEKIKKIMVVLPDLYESIDFRKLRTLRDEYPAIYQVVEKRLETGWEKTFELLEQGKAEGVVREDVNIYVLKIMIESSIEGFLSKEELLNRDIAYREALDELVRIVMNGITVKHGAED